MSHRYLSIICITNMAENVTKNKRNFKYTCASRCLCICVYAFLMVSTSGRQQHHFDAVAGNNFRVSKSVVSVSCHRSPPSKSYRRILSCSSTLYIEYITEQWVKCNIWRQLAASQKKCKMQNRKLNLICIKRQFYMVYMVNI